MKPFWSIRIWDMYVDADYAKYTGKPPRWVLMAYKRYWSDDKKWYGI